MSLFEGRHTVTDLAKHLGITVKTIVRWEKAGHIKKAKRDWKGWRFYTAADIKEIEKTIRRAEYERRLGG